MRGKARFGAVTALAAGLAAVALTGPAPATAFPQVDPEADLARAAVAAVRAHPGAAHVGDQQTFRASDAIVDTSGSSHVRMDRSYQGLLVLGGDLVVHRADDGSWQGVSQTLELAPDLAVAPSVSPQEATTRALASSRVTSSIERERVDDAPGLVVDATGDAPRLAWEVISLGIQHDGTPSRLATYVDARTGQVLRTEQQIQTADGVGQSLYGGTVPLTTVSTDGGFQLTDPTRGDTHTTDMGNRSDSVQCRLFGRGCQPGTLFADADNAWGDGTNSIRQSAAVDAQYGSNVTWDYYLAVHGREGIFGDGDGSFSRVHYGNRYVNAFWNGSYMTYGDGDGVNFGPLVSLDVAGHEMTHGVTENTANLIYSGESGGLNEATSDIFGTLVEFFAANAEDAGDYLIGEEFDLRSQVGFRRMDRPSSDGSSFDCYVAGIGNADVHYSSGVGNHFFYLLAEGSGPKTIGGVAHNSPTCDGSSLTGIGRDAAGAIWYRALTVYMTSSTGYAGARTATLNAARDLYGVGSAQHTAVAAAWSAVSVG